MPEDHDEASGTPGTEAGGLRANAFKSIGFEGVFLFLLIIE
jgi:hypothetical protein